MVKNRPDNVTRLKRRRWRTGRWFFLFPALLFALHFGWGRLEQRKLARMVEQCRGNGEPILPEDFDQPAIPDSGNAAIDLRAAGASIDEARFSDLGNLQCELPLTQRESSVIRTALADFPDALPAVDSAMGKAQINWGLRRRTPVISAALPDLKPQRRLADLLAADLLLAHEAGNDARAVKRAAQILFVSRAVDQQPALISHLVANGIAALAAERVVQIAPTLRIAAIDGEPLADAERKVSADPLEVQALIATLLAQDANNQGLARSMRGERMMLLDTSTAFVAGDFSQTQAGPTSAPPDMSESAKRNLFGYAVKPMVLSDAQLLIGYMSRSVVATGAPTWPTARLRLPARPPEVAKHPKFHLFASMLIPSLDRIFMHQFQVRTDMTLAATSLAIRRYTLNHDGAFPSQLADLSPLYLPAVPVDPMTAGTPLRFDSGNQFGSTHPGDPIIYSVGENGTDESGSEQPLRKTLQVLDRWEMQDVVVHLKQQPRKTPEDVDDRTAPTPATTVPSNP